MREQYLVHHGIEGQKWGIRRYQNPDGSLTAEGKARYKEAKKQGTKDYYKNTRKNLRNKISSDSVGKHIAKFLLMGPIGMTEYNALRAQDISRGKSLAVMFLGGAIGTLLVTDIKANKAGKKAAKEAVGQ